LRAGRSRLASLVELTRIQWAISFALLPLTAMFFAEISMIGPAVNLLAIPVFNLVLVPLALLATLLTPVAGAGDALIFVTGVLASATMLALHELAALRWASLPLAPPGFFVAATACCGALLALAAPPLPARRLAWLALLPLHGAAPPSLPRGAARVVMLDVGHGLAVVVETREHRLLFDAGPRFPSGFDSGEEIALPALGMSGRRALDRLIVSHADNDHAGGAAAIQRAIPGVDALVGPDVTAVEGRRCERGQYWIWDEVAFTILHPPADFSARGNDSSCVLRVTTRSTSVLITGDIEDRGERALTAVADLRADVVIVPHHGSASSSSPSFVAATHAKWALVSAAHANRWGFPKPEVRRRWEEHGATVLVTGDSGAVTIELDSAGALVSTERRRRVRYWDPVS
jgi:competence protein ComEC